MTVYVPIFSLQHIEKTISKIFFISLFFFFFFFSSAVFTYIWEQTVRKAIKPVTSGLLVLIALRALNIHIQKRLMVKMMTSFPVKIFLMK